LLTDKWESRRNSLENRKRMSLFYAEGDKNKLVKKMVNTAARVCSGTSVEVNGISTYSFSMTECNLASMASEGYTPRRLDV
jgi:hypothetical protein